MVTLGGLSSTGEIFSNNPLRTKQLSGPQITYAVNQSDTTYWARHISVGNTQTAENNTAKDSTMQVAPPH